MVMRAHGDGPGRPGQQVVPAPRRRWAGRSWWWCLLGVGLLGWGWSSPAQDLPWRVPEAEVRLLVLPDLPLEHTLRVDLPLACQSGYQGIAVHDPGGEPLPATLWRTDQCLLAVEIPLTTATLAKIRAVRAIETAQPAQVLQAAIQIYLLRQATPWPAPAGPRRPLRLAVRPVAVRDIIASPAAGREYRHYARTQLPPAFVAEIPAFPTEANQSEFLQYLMPKCKMHYQLTTVLVAPKPLVLRFAVRNRLSGAWFLFLDQAGVFSWGEPLDLDPDYVLSAAINLDPGLHRLDFSGIVGPEDTMPVLGVRELPGIGPPQPVPPTWLAAGNSARTLALNYQGDPGVVGLQVRLSPVFAFGHGSTVLSAIKYTDLSYGFGSPRPERQLRLDGRSLTNDGTTGDDFMLLGPANQLRLLLAGGAERPRDLTLTLGLDWTMAREVLVDFVPRALPFLEPAEGPLEVKYRLDYPAILPGPFREATGVVLRQLAADDQLLEEQRTPMPASPFRQVVAVPRLHPTAACLELSLRIRDFPLVPPARIYLVDPTRQDLRFGHADEHLRLADGYAVIRRRHALSGTLAVPERPLRRLAVLDDLIAASQHVADNLDPADWVGRQSGLSLTLYPLAGPRLTGDRPVLRKFEQLGRILTSDADAVVLALGEYDLQAGLDLRDFQAQWRFLIEAVLNRGKLPVLVTLPVHGSLTPEVLRPYALLIKELAAEYHVPAADYYSASLLGIDVESFYRFPGAEGVLSATPNAEGRRWFLRLLLEALAEYHPEVRLGP